MTSPTKSKFLSIRKLTALLLLLLATFRAEAANGLTGCYFDNDDFTSQVTLRTDATVNFNWGASIPEGTALTSGEYFSVRWTGQIDPQFSETYTFYVAADNGSRLWIDDKLIAARTVHVTGGLKMRGTVKLTAGRRVNIRLEMMERGGDAVAKLEWSSPSLARQVIPQSRLFTDEGKAETGALMKEVWDGQGVTDITISKLKTHPNYPDRPLARDFIPSFESFHRDWKDSFGTRVTGFIVPQVSGSYSFAVAGDEIVELFLSTDSAEGNRALIASAPSATGFREWTKFPSQVSTTRTLTAGQKYFVELLHVESTGSDHFSVAWKTPGSETWEVIGGDYLVQAGIDRPQPLEESALLDSLATGHPRVLATQERFDWLKAQILANPSGNQANWYDKLLDQADDMLVQEVNTFNATDNLTVSRSVLDRMYTLALVWKISGDSKYAERAWLELDAARNFPDWQPSKFLCVAEMTHAFAIGLDWFYHYWSAPRLSAIRSAIVSKGFNPAIADYDGDEDWTLDSANTSNPVNNGGMVLGALAMGTSEEAKVEEILQRALASVRPVLGHYTADNGAIYEGANYWGYSARYLVRMLSGLEGVLGSDFGSLSSKDGLSESGVVPMHMTGPTNKMFNFGDALPYEKAGAELFWFARRYNRPVCAWFERKFCNESDFGPEALDLLWYDPRGSNPSLESVSPDVYFRGATKPTSPAYDTLEAGVFREKWNDSRATYLAFKGGNLGEHTHTDLDAGSFVLYANGKNWALDMGTEDYSLRGVLNPTSSSGTDRWDYYRKRAEGHNTLVINPGSGPDQQLGSDCPIQFWRSSPDGDGSASVMDLTPAYKNATNVRRGFRLLNGRHDVIVQDEISLSTSSTVWWFMHFNSGTTTCDIAADRTSAMLTQGDERLWCKILSGDGVFTVQDSTPFASSPKPAGQNENNEFQKLSIQLTDVTSTRLTVYLKPLANGDPIPEPAALPTVSSLDEWTISGINDPPTISDVATQTTTKNIATAALPFTIGDDLTAPGSLTLTKSSSNPTLVPPANIVFGGSGANRTVTVTPAANQSGAAFITLTVSDGTHTARDEFWLSVMDGGTPLTLSVPLAASADDAEESVFGTVDLTSTHLELPNARGPIATTGGSDPLVGLRFAGLPIPQGATITHAAIQFTAAGTQSEATTLDITVEATDQAAAFSATARNLSNRPITTTRLVWQPPAWSVMGEAAASQRTPNLAGILQEIVSRPGWASGNAIALFIKGTGRRTADAFDKSGGTPPRLSVTYVIEPTASFAQWLTTYPSLTGTNALSTADPDGDAFNNLLEYALATHPTQANTAPYTTALEGSTLAFTYARPSLAPDLTYAVEWSRTLAAGTWSSAGVTQQITSDNGTIRTVRAAVPAGTEALFLRLKVTAP
ncbi:MAG: PA14 domain-containing protein [Akkermansiaceae bacterium]|nr:PA14 domain-containing protein [Akkermansiaceae bacterium]